MRTKTKTRKMNEQRIKQLNMQKGNQKSKKNIRKSAKAYDLEKAAIVYALINNYSAKYQYIRDRYPSRRDYKLWILNGMV